MRLDQPSEQSMADCADSVRIWKSFWLIFAISLVLRLAVFGVGLAAADEHGRNPAFFWHDSGQYLNPAQSLVRHGTYTVESGGEQILYFLRPAGYPLFIAGCYKIGGERTAAILLPQLILGAFACSFAFWIAAILFDQRMGWMTGLLMAFDQLLIAYSNKVMSETLSLFFLTGSTLLFLLYLARQRRIFLWLSGLSLGACTLAHAGSLYYWIVPVAGLALWGGLSAKEKGRAGLIFVLAYFLTIGLWQTRNYLVFGVYQVSPKGTVTGVTAARVLWLEQKGQTREEVANAFYARIEDAFSKKYGLPNKSWKDWTDPELRHRYFSHFLDTQNEEAMRVFREHIGRYTKLVVLSMLKITVLALPNAELCRFATAEELDSKEEGMRSRMRKALAALAEGDAGTFWQEFRQVPFCKLFGFAWNGVYWLATIPAALLGTYLVVRRWPWAYSILLLGTIAYFVSTTSLTMAGDGMQRYRLRILPHIYCLAALGWLGRGTKWQQSSPR